MCKYLWSTMDVICYYKYKVMYITIVWNEEVTSVVFTDVRKGMIIHNKL